MTEPRDVLSSQLVEEPVDPPFVDLCEQPTELDRRLLALKAQALREPASVFTQRRQPGEERVLERSRKLRGGPFRRKSPDPVDVTDHLFCDELAQDLDAVKGASRGPTVDPLGEPLHVGCAAEERADELQRFRRREAGKGDARALSAQTHQAGRRAWMASFPLTHDEQERFVRREPRETDEHGETRVVGVADVVALDDERLGPADVREPAFQRATLAIDRVTGRPGG